MRHLIEANLTGYPDTKLSQRKRSVYFALYFQARFSIEELSCCVGHCVPSAVPKGNTPQQLPKYSETRSEHGKNEEPQIHLNC